MPAGSDDQERRFAKLNGLQLLEEGSQDSGDLEQLLVKKLAKGQTLTHGGPIWLELVDYSSGTCDSHVTQDFIKQGLLLATV